jgi:hypothetical protein
MTVCSGIDTVKCVVGDVVDSVIGAVVGVVPVFEGLSMQETPLIMIVDINRRVSAAVGGAYPAAVFATCGHPCGSLPEAARCTARASSMVRPAI